ncbi:MAG TPA: DUF2167 domain-containing protein [Caulobacterales bacterium]|nr:DUF2167 domain-containing protein [Caulobacterales bacterium]
MGKLFACAGAVLAAALLLASPAYADGRGKPSPDVAEAPVHAVPLRPTLSEPAPQGQSGQIALRDGVTLNVPDGWRFYPAEQARAFLSRSNAAAPSGDTLGMLAPASERIDAPDAWACIISYDAIGYVRADTASGLGEANFEDQVKRARASQNRPFEGFAIAPAFDAAAFDLSWAERTAPPAAGGKDFRHEQKALGRQAVVGFTSIGTADQMPEITAAAPTLFSMLSFPEGQRYADFNAGGDRLSNYGVPGLITGIAATATAETAAQQQGPAAGGINSMYLWIAAGVIALAAGGFFLTRRRRDRNIEPEA